MKLDIYDNNTYEEEAKFPTQNNAKMKKKLKRMKKWRDRLE